MGSCHCGAVQFRVETPSSTVEVWRCNCSICSKKQNHHFVVPATRFTLLQGSDNLTTYTFNTHTSKHPFCKTCGVESFYVPRSNPDGYGIMVHCIDGDTITQVIYRDFDGKNWEREIEGSDIVNQSKE